MDEHSMDEILLRSYEGEELQAAVEAILFTTGKAVETPDLARVLHTDTGKILEALTRLQQLYAEPGRGITLVRLEDAWQLCTKKDFYDCLIELELTPNKPTLTEVQLETLSVIAYKQPVTKSEIERIRGVNSDHAVNRLIEYGLVRELGRAKLPGRPILFGTTEEFLRIFGVSSRDDLPDISPVKLEDFRQEAEKEAETIVV